MKIAFAGKGGVGKTTLCAWLGELLAAQGNDVILVDADTALNLGQACGLSANDLPTPLIFREDMIRERIGSGFMSLNPFVADLPDSLCVELPITTCKDSHTVQGRKRLLVMGSITGAGGGCACGANALLKALLAHLITLKNTWVLVDLEAGVEHLGRGTVADVDGLVVVSEPGYRSLETAAHVAGLAADLGLTNQVLALNRIPDAEHVLDSMKLPTLDHLPQKRVAFPMHAPLVNRQLFNPCVVGLEQKDLVEKKCRILLELITQNNVSLAA